MSAIETQAYCRQSLSLNDLDHVLGKHYNARPESQRPSSSDLSFDSNWIPAHPLEPVQPPPARVKTPPGLPSFGTKQATLLRLQQRRSSRTTSRIRSWLSSHDESDEHAVIGGSASTTASPQASPILPPSSFHQSLANGTTDSRDLLRRTLAAIGMFRVLDPDPVERASSSPLQISASVLASSSKSKLNLPPWVYMSNVSGPLARADDGEFHICPKDCSIRARVYLLFRQQWNRLMEVSRNLYERHFRASVQRPRHWSEECQQSSSIEVGEEGTITGSDSGDVDEPEEDRCDDGTEKCWGHWSCGGGECRVRGEGEE